MHPNNLPSNGVWGDEPDTVEETYPDWERTIRSAQAVLRLKEYGAKAEEREEKAKAEALLGEKLQQALHYLGIEVEQPTVNGVVLGDIHFSLYYGKFMYTNESVSFTLMVRINDPETVWRDQNVAFYERDMWHKFSVKLELADAAGWRNHQAYLANVIDTLRENYATNLAKWQDIQERRAKQATEPTVREAFLNALDAYLEERFGMRLNSERQQ